MKLAVITGEASGDLHAAAVVRELRRIAGDLEVFGIGGDELEREGMRLLHRIEGLSVVGLFNVLAQLPMFRRVFRSTLGEIAAERPDAVLLVDFPGFNLRLAKRCSEMGIPVIYYISPQLWAWRQQRVRHIARYVDHMLVIFPFEADFYARHGVAATYTGHPLVEQLLALRRPATLPEAPLRLALLPGSRLLEIEKLFPPMIEAASILAGQREVEPFVIRAPTIPREMLEKELEKHSGGASIVIREGDNRRTIAEADLALCASGTATLETAIIGVPMVVVYKLTPLSYLAARRLVTLRHFSLVNIVAEKEIVPELLQHEVTGARIAAEASRILQPEKYLETLQEFDGLRSRLAGEGAARRAAEKINTLLAARRSSSR